MLPVFIVPELPTSGEVEIIGDEARHAISAVRIKLNERISLTDGHGGRAVAEVIELNRKSLRVTIIEHATDHAPYVELSVLQALTKGDRARETVELLTEAGVDRIIPWAAKRSIGQWKSDVDSLAKWQVWARESTKQSRRSWIPQVSSPQTLIEITERFNEFDLVLLFHESDGEKLSAVLKTVNPRKVLIIIGPEGGVAEDEVSAFIAAGARSVSMGQPIFRSAHAGAAALAAVQTALEIW